MRYLASKYALNYKSKEKVGKYQHKENILTGLIGNTRISICIYDYIDGGGAYEGHAISKRYTVVEVNGIRKKLQHPLLGYYPIEKIERLIDNIR